ncbi:hypothetical protein [Dactylosporangium cerinum]
MFGLGLLEPTEFALNSDGLQRPPAFVGVLFTLQGAGAVIGGLFAGRAVRAFGETRTAGTGLTAAAVGTALIAVPLLPVVLAGFALYGAALPWFVVAQQTKLQRTTPAAPAGPRRRRHGHADQNPAGDRHRDRLGGGRRHRLSPAADLYRAVVRLRRRVAVRLRPPRWPVTRLSREPGHRTWSWASGVWHSRTT